MAMTGIRANVELGFIWEMFADIKRLREMADYAEYILFFEHYSTFCFSSFFSCSDRLVNGSMQVGAVRIMSLNCQES